MSLVPHISMAFVPSKLRFKFKSYLLSKCLRSFSIASVKSVSSTQSNMNSESDAGAKCSSPSSSDSTSSSLTNPWRNAATLMAASPASNGNGLAYLIIQRSKGSRVMPGGIVFPGGTIASSDSSPKWDELFKKAGTDLNALQLSFMKPTANKPKMYSDPKLSVSLRICAIREAFEECGILLCSRAGENNDSSSSPILQSESEVSTWQERVRTNAENFLLLCEQFQCVPKLSSLNEWSNWLTPTTIHEHKRFDTLFYMVLVNQTLSLVGDPHETSECRWSTAEKLLTDHNDGKGWLPPPQLYELTRLKGVQSQELLSRCVEARKQLGIDQFFPVFTLVKDGMLFALPGDDLYPNDVDPRGPSERHERPESFAQLRELSKNFHRAEISSDGKFNYIINVAKHGHIYS